MKMSLGFSVRGPWRVGARDRARGRMAALRIVSGQFRFRWLGSEASRQPSSNNNNRKKEEEVEVRCFRWFSGFREAECQMSICVWVWFTSLSGADAGAGDHEKHEWKLTFEFAGSEVCCRITIRDS